MELVDNMRASLTAALDSPIVPIGCNFLGGVLGCLHIAVQLLDVVYAENRDAIVAIGEDEIKIGEFSLLVNAMLDIANTKLQLPEHLRQEG